MVTMWQFAGAPPQVWTEPQGCPPLQEGVDNPDYYKTMTNEDLIHMAEECRTERGEAVEQVRLWESWADIEREAHASMKGIVK